jgi:arsenite methyltransferase
MKHTTASNSFPHVHPDLCDELPFWSAPFGLKLLDSIDYKTDITALDIGFGSGFPLIELAMRLGESCTVYGIDPWKDILTQVKRKIDCFGIRNASLLTGYAESIPLHNGSVDLITSNNGINNVHDAEQVFSECARILKPGGQFTWTMNTEKTMFEFYTLLEKVLTEMGLDGSVEAMYCHIDEKRPPVNRLLALLQQKGFTIRALESEQFSYRFSDGTAMLNHYFVKIAFLESWKSFLPPDREEEVFLRLEAALNEYARLCGGMKLSVPFMLVDAVKAVP